MAWGQREDGTTPAPVRSGGNGQGALSFIGNEVTVTGSLSGQGDLHIDGAIEGDIQCNTLILGSGGRIKGNITAEKATLAGTIGGTVNARMLIIEKAAQINGDLTYETITIENGAQVEGRLSRRAEKASAPTRTPSAAAEQPLKLVAGDE